MHLHISITGIKINESFLNYKVIGLLEKAEKEGKAISDYIPLNSKEQRMKDEYLKFNSMIN